MKLSKYPVFLNLLFVLAFFSPVMGMGKAGIKRPSADLEKWIKETEFVEVANVWYPITENTKIDDLKEMYFQAFKIKQDLYAIRIDGSFDAGYIDEIVLLEGQWNVKETMCTYKTSSFYPKNYLNLEY